MNLIQAFKVCFERFSDFSGISTWSDYWDFAIFIFVGSVVAEIIDAALAGVPFWEYELPYGPIGSYGPAGSILLVVCLVPFIAVSVRRLHDADFSGYWLFMALSLFGLVFLFWMYLFPSDPRTNRFGPDPLENVRPKNGAPSSHPPFWWFIFLVPLSTAVLVQVIFGLSSLTGHHLDFSSILKKHKTRKIFFPMIFSISKYEYPLFNKESAII